MRLEALAGRELSDVLAKVGSGERLGRRDFLRLWDTCDLTGLGAVANVARERASGGQTIYRYQMHLNHTGRPVTACPECDAQHLSCKSVPTVENLAQVAARNTSSPGGEIHLTGGPDAELHVEDLRILVQRIRSLNAQLHLRAFSWSELYAAAKKDRQQPASVLTALMEAGIDSLAGGVLADLTPEDPHTGPASIQGMDQYIPWIRAAAELGLKCEFVWVLGDGDDPEVLADLLICVRGLQDRWNIFECCTPLLFQPRSEGVKTPMPTGYNQLRAIAAARLFLDNISRVRGPIAAIGESVAQAAQWYGADDIGGIPFPDGSDDGNAGTAKAGRENVIELVRSAARDPVDLYAGAR